MVTGKYHAGHMHQLNTIEEMDWLNQNILNIGIKNLKFLNVICNCITKHKSEDYKISELQYYLTKNKESTTNL